MADVKDKLVTVSQVDTAFDYVNDRVNVIDNTDKNINAGKYWTSTENGAEFMEFQLVDDTTSEVYTLGINNGLLYYKNQEE